MQQGQIPAGALSEPILRSLIARGTIDASKIVELDLSAPIPNYPITMQGYLAPELKEKIRAAFLELKDPEILQSFRVEGFKAADDASYDVLRETAQLLNLELAKMN